MTGIAKHKEKQNSCHKVSRRQKRGAGFFFKYEYKEPSW